MLGEAGLSAQRPGIVPQASREVLWEAGLSAKRPGIVPQASSDVLGEVGFSAQRPCILPQKGMKLFCRCAVCSIITLRFLQEIGVTHRTVLCLWGST